MNQLRYGFLLECAEKMRRYNERFREACWDENPDTARAYFDAMAAIGTHMRKTLEEIEASHEREAA